MHVHWAALHARVFLFFVFERAWYAKIRHVTSLCISVGVSMETPPFTMTSFQSAPGASTRVVRLTVS